MDTIDLAYQQLVGTDAVSQFRGWIVWKLRTIAIGGVAVRGVKKLGVLYFN